MRGTATKGLDVTLIQVPDGRNLDIEVTGPASGEVLVFHHGTPGAVTQTGSMQRAAHARGLRLVTFSRPGYGSSSRLAGRRVADDVTDVSAVLDIWRSIAAWPPGGPAVARTRSRRAP